MKTSFISLVGASLVLTTTATFARGPASAPAGSTALCKDGTFYSAASKKGACAGHKGIKTWYGTSGTAMGASGVTAATASSAAATTPTVASSVSPVVGVPAGKVWVNTSTKVYHCPSDQYYGKTKNGAYMTEADAKAKGFHADHGKVCQ